MVSQLQHAAARAGSPSRAAALVAELRRRSPEFVTLCEERRVGRRRSDQKHFLHPEVGPLSLHCRTSLDTDRDQTLIVLTAIPGGIDADRLRLLAVVGTCSMGAGGSA